MLGEAQRNPREPGFWRMVQDCGALAALDPAERRARALEAAWRIIDLALARGDAGVALYIVTAMERQRDPGESLATKTLALLEKTWAAVPDRPPPHPGAIKPPCEQGGPRGTSPPRPFPCKPRP
jgi:hypothetical protein